MKVKIYEGLKSDRFTYIDTNMPYLERYVIKSKWKLVRGDIHTSNYPPMYGASKESPQHMNNARYWYVNANNNNNIETRFYDGLNTRFLPFTEIAEIVDTPHGFSFNGENYNYERLSGDIQETIEIFQFEGHKSVPRYHAVNYFIIEDNDTEILHLVPCLTSDNEACMLDLLSGELYRNQGSGAFSVEGEMLYEFETPIVKQVMRKPSVVVRLREWITRSEDYSENIIQTNIPLSTTTPTTITAPMNKGVMWNLVRFSNTFRRLQISNGCWIYVDTGSISHNIGRNKTIKVYSDRLECADNVYTLPTKETHISIIFAYNSQSPQTLGEIKQDGVIHLHPCDILYHPTLPPQSAMIDPNTGTIYTNQGSGNFTCEGADLGIWTDTMFNDMRIKDVKADMVCIMDNGEPRVVYERTQPWISDTDGSAKLLRHIFANESIDNKAQQIGRLGTADLDLYKSGQPWFSTQLPPRTDFVNLSPSDPLMQYNASTGGFKYSKSDDYKVWNKPPHFSFVLAKGKYIVQTWAVKVDNQTSLVNWEGVRFYDTSGNMLLELIEGRQEPKGHLEEKPLTINEETTINIDFKTGLNYEGYLAIKKIE